MSINRFYLFDSIPTNVKEICSAFVENFTDETIEFASQKYLHDNTWKETDEELADITLEILDALNDVWKNPAFETRFAKSQSEGTYIADVISPLYGLHLRSYLLRSLLSSARKLYNH